MGLSYSEILWTYMQIKKYRYYSRIRELYRNEILLEFLTIENALNELMTRTSQYLERVKLSQ